jgi:hypothetical protein
MIRAFAAAGGPPGPPSLELTSVAQSSPDKRWNWTAYVSGKKEAIERIKCIVYTLHPTFADPVKKVCKTENPLYPFALAASGWGTFDLLARVEYKDGSSENLVHTLDFSNSGFTVEDNTDRPGQDLSNASADTLLSCQTLCRNDWRCASYTFIPPYSSPFNYKGPPIPRCFLHSGEPAQVTYPGVISGKYSK